MRGIHNAQPSNYDMYRGAAMHPEEISALMNEVKPGAEFHMPLASFTPSQKGAGMYGRSVTFHIAPGAKGLWGGKIFDRDMDPNAPAREFVSGGKFKVDSIDTTPTHVIHLSQIATHDPDQLISEGHYKNVPDNPPRVSFVRTSEDWQNRHWEFDTRSMGGHSPKGQRRRG